MEAEFDKQIDTILREMAAGKTLPEKPQVSHLDADELSAYSENALPAQARLRATEHLADCSKCRHILSTLVLLNSEAESEIIHEKSSSIVSIPALPWYRRLFAVPNLAYTMGALVLLLVGSVSFLVYQNSQGEATVAQLEQNQDKVRGPSGASSEGDSAASSSSDSNSATAANVSMPAANSVSNVTSASNRSILPSEESDSKISTEATPNPASPTTVGRVAERTESDDVLSKPATVGTGSGLDARGGEVRDKVAGEPPPAPVATQNVPTTDVVAGQQPVEQNVQMNRAPENTMMPDGQSRNQIGGSPKRSAPAAPRREVNKTIAADSENQKEKKDEGEASRTVGGKTFRSVGGVWTDSAYQGGSMTSVKRGTDGYKKLDSGLQNIGNSLGGTILVVWNGKNYRIQ